MVWGKGIHAHPVVPAGRARAPPLLWPRGASSNPRRVLWLSLLLSGAVLEITELVEVEPAVRVELIGTLELALAQASGCGFERRWCDASPCAAHRGTEPAVRVSVVGGVTKLSVLAERLDRPARVEEFWPLDSSTWAPAAERLARALFPRPACAPPPAPITSVRTAPASGPSLLPPILVGAAATALGVGIGLHALSRAALADARGFSEWEPRVAELRSEAQTQELVGNVVLGSAVGLAALALTVALLE